MTATFAQEVPETRPSGLAGSATRVLARAPVHVVLVALALFWLSPTFGLLVTSFRLRGTVAASGWWTALTAPRQLTLEPYLDLLGNSRVIEALANTIFITVPTSVLVVLIAAMAGYAFAWIEFKGREQLFLLLVALLVVPLQMALIPAARLFGTIGIFDTVYAAIVFHIAFGLPFAIFLLRNFFIGIPHELLEAARIDGASEWRIFSRVIVPLGMPAIASLLIFQFLWTWNDLLVALVMAPGEAAPLTVFIREQLRQFGANVDIIAPGAFLSMIIPLVVFFAFQRYFVQGLLAGSVK